MNSNPLKSYAVYLHRDLLDRLQNICHDEKLELTRRLENSVQACSQSISNLYQLKPENNFNSLEEEILFFKLIKPMFTSEREFYQRLYHANIFGEQSEAYRKKELIRMDKLLNENSEFVSYYLNQCTHNDHAWFCKGQAALPTTLCMWPGETNLKYTSARDGWVGGLLAVERYIDWLKMDHTNE